ncbi:MAG: hypothetical protein R3C39_06800 [Dehalococcoidia bacterium]
MGEAPPLPANAVEAPSSLPRRDGDLTVFILNVGDGDAILIEFPKVGGQRVWGIVDCFKASKMEPLMDALGVDALRFVCATHPHFDHIAGIRSVITNAARPVEEFWDSGFRFTSTTYNGIVQAVTDGGMQFVRPTAGFETWVNESRVSVLSPSIALRNRYDTYGIDPNNASVVIRVEYPYLRPEAGFPERDTVGNTDDRAARAIILGGDAQTDAWGQVLQDFPHLNRQTDDWSRLISARKGREPLLCDVLKVSHHGSKHGVNLELVERFGDTGGGPSTGPRYLVNSSADGPASKHGFPHAVTQEILREVRQPTAKSGAQRLDDHALGIHYTAQRLGNGAAGSVAVVLKADGSVPDLYRFGDEVDDDIDLDQARLVRRINASP